MSKRILLALSCVLLAGITLLTIASTYTSSDSAHRFNGTIYATDSSLAGTATTFGHVNLQIGPKTTWLVFDGDSITSGTGAATQTYPYALTNEFLTNACFVSKTNAAVYGELVSTMVANYPTYIAPFKPDISHDSVVFIMGGVNDIASSASAATVWARLTNYWGLARADGFKVVAFTITDKSNYSGAQFEERRKLNQLIRNSNTLFDFLVDAEAIFPSAVATTVDTIHLSNEASRYLAMCVFDVLSRSRPISHGVPFTQNVVGSYLNIRSYITNEFDYRATELAARISAVYPRMLLESEDFGNALLFDGGNNGDVGRISWRSGTGTFGVGLDQWTYLKFANSNLVVQQPLTVMSNLFGGATNVLVSTTAKDFFYVSVPTTNAIGGKVEWEVVCTDGTDTQSQSGNTRFDAIAKATTVTAGLTTLTNAAVASGGSTLTVLMAANVATNNVFALGVTATTSLTTTNLLLKWRLETPAVFTVNALP